MPKVVRVLITLVVLCLMLGPLTAVASDSPSFELTARYLLEIIKAFRATYVLKVVQHIEGGAVSANEEWAKDAHHIPLPAQFVKEAAALVAGFEIDLIGLTPLNPANHPKTKAEADALLQLMKSREKPIVSFVDGNYFKAISADLSLVQSCADCHNQHPRATRRDFKKWDVMGGVVVRLRRDASPEGSLLGPEPSSRPVRPLEQGPASFDQPSPPWLR